MRSATSAPTFLSQTRGPATAGMPGRADGRPRRAEETAETTEQEVAAYLFDLLVGARCLAATRKHRFLAYLIGMAVEEARLLTLGRSAAGPRKQAAAPDQG